MGDIKDTATKSTDPAVRKMIARAETMEVSLVWDRYGAMVPQCGFGETGLCCRHCLQGPCRIDPFGEGAKTGICGATADTMVARGLDRAIAAGTAAHSGHAKHLAHTLKKMAQGAAKDYAVKEAPREFKRLLKFKPALDQVLEDGIVSDSETRMLYHIMPFMIGGWTYKAMSKVIPKLKNRPKKKQAGVLIAEYVRNVMNAKKPVKLIALITVKKRK